MRTSLALAVIMMVLSEYFSSTNGVGYVLLISKNTFQFPPMWAAIVLIGVLGYLLNAPLPPRRAPRARLAPRLARGDATVVRCSRSEDLGKTYGTGANATHAVGDVSFSIDEGEFVCVVGPSGCGKTTLLKCIAGLLRPSAGEVLLRGAAVTGPPEEMALVFQEYSRSLMPWMSVRNNVLLPLRHKKLSQARARRPSSRRRSTRSGSSRFIDRYPWQLSGGMQQRVAIARALAYQPSILLMDEPFASVDAQTRGDLEDLVLQVREEFGITILFVTHDIDESVYLVRPGRRAHALRRPR